MFGRTVTELNIRSEGYLGVHTVNIEINIEIEFISLY